jgi:3-keto-L-gulonate-6-phosphate decarboxylase
MHSHAGTFRCQKVPAKFLRQHIIEGKGQELYRKEIVPKMMKKFGYKNMLQVPRLEKIVVNMGVSASLEKSAIDDAARKVTAVRRIVGPNIRVEVDGGINPHTIPIVVSYGADTLVAGNAIFAQPNRLAAIDALRKAARPSS